MTTERFPDCSSRHIERILNSHLHGRFQTESGTQTKQLLPVREMAKNVLGTDLQPCCYDPMTGFLRDGFCKTGGSDYGVHVVCAEMTKEFLEFSQRVGNDLSTPISEFGFPGLVPGNRWCLCVSRWRDALEQGLAPPVILEATHMSAIEFVSLEDLKKHAIEM